MEPCANAMCRALHADRITQITALRKHTAYLEARIEKMREAMRKQLPEHLDEFVTLVCDMSFISQDERTEYERQLQSMRKILDTQTQAPVGR